MGCSGSKEKDTTAKKEWDELVAKNEVAKLLDAEWKSPSKGKGNALIKTPEAVTKSSVDEVEAFFKKYMDFEASEKEGNVEHFQFENGTGNAVESQANEAQDFYFEEIAAAEEAAEEKKEEEAAAEGEEKKEGEEGEEKKEEEKVELKVLTPLEFMEQGVWAHKPASMKLNEKGGRTFGGGWKRRYLNVPAGEEKLNYAEAKGKASKGTIGFNEIVSVEELTAEEAKQVKAPAKVANFSFVVKTATLKYNFGCETEEDAKRTIEAIKTFIKDGETEETGPEQGLLTVATSIKPKEGATIKFYHQVQYEIKEEEPEAPAAEAEGETAAAPAEGEAAEEKKEEEAKEEAAEEKKEEAAEEEKKEEEAAEEKKEEEAAASE